MVKIKLQKEFFSNRKFFKKGNPSLIDGFFISTDIRFFVSIEWYNDIYNNITKIIFSMKQKKHAHTILIIIIFLAAFLIIRSAIIGQINNNIRDADYAEDALQAAAGCTAPTISNISVTNISNSGATISWITNQRSTSQVRLGLSTNSMSWLTVLDTPASTNGVTTHSYQLSNLQASKKYYYRVRSSNGSCQRTSNTLNFTTSGTSGGNDITSPTIPSGLSASNLTSTSFTLNWNASTDPLINGFASGIKNYEVYGPAGACNAVHYNGLASAGFCGFVTNTNASNYSLNISGLTPNTTYSGTGVNAGFVVMAFDNAGNYSSPTATRFSVSTPQTGTVDVCPNIAGVQTSVPSGYIINSSGDCVLPPDTQPPTGPSGLTSPNKTSNSVSLSWSPSTDNVGVTSYMVYMNNGSNPIGNTSNTTFTVTGLSPATTYSFYVRATDAAGNISVNSSAISVTTNSVVVTDVSAPTLPTNVSHSSTTYMSTIISWSASTDDTLSPNQITYDVYGPTDACNALVNGSPIAGYCGEVIGTTSMQISGLTPNTQYNQSSGVRGGFIIQAHDNAGHYSSGTPTYLAVTTPNSPAGATTISNVQVSAITPTTATITWTTNNPATGVVNYGTTTSYGSTASNPLMLTSHTFNLTTLAPLTSYNFRVTSVDGNSASVSSANLTFTTPDSGGPMTCANAASLQDRRQMWIWHDNSQMITPGSTKQNELFNFIATKKVDMIYLNAPASFINSNGPALRTFIKTLWNTHCTRVQFLEGRESWSNPPYTDVLAWANAAKNFNNSIPSGDPKLYGLNVDVESYSTWGSSTGRSNFVSMYNSIRNTLSGTGIKTVAVIPRWLDTNADIDPSSSVRIAFMRSVIDAVDEIGIMNYVTNTSSFTGDATTELAYGQSTGKIVVIGAETIDLRPWGGSNTVTSFWGHSCLALNNVLNSSFSSFISTAPTMFGGYAIHDYYQLDGSGWKYLCP